MWINNMVLKGSSVGFGLTEAEAEDDLYVNVCRFDIKKDTERRFKKRRDELQPWLPKPNMLHFTGVGCLVYENGRIRNMNGGMDVEIGVAGFEAYYYLSKVLLDSLSYTDIIVVAQAEVNTFFKNISTRFKPVQDYPIVSVTNVDMAFEPDITYFLKNGIIVGSNWNRFGAKMLGTAEYYVVDKVGSDNEKGILSYLGYRMGVEFAKGGVGLGTGDKEL